MIDASPPSARIREPERPSRSAIASGAAALVALHVALGLYLVHLNSLFYQRFGPFYDSVGYLNRLVDLRVAALEGGLSSALGAAVQGSTVALPWLLYAPLAVWIEPQRAVGIWIQVAVATVAALTMYRHFAVVRRIEAPLAVVQAGAFSGIAATFFFNGGMADFRMDLLQYLLYAMVMALYLGARRTFSWRPWLLLGLGVGALCLGRSTSPVYLVLLAAVLIPADLMAARERARELARRWAGAALVALLTAGWFYVLNGRLLVGYYVGWNPDVRARLPWRESVTHLKLAAGHLGPVLLVAGLAACVITLWRAWRERGGLTLRDLDWRSLVFSFVPLGYLAASGSGLNPFVSIVGVAGVLLFLLDPLSGPRPAPSRSRTAMALILIAGAIAANAYAGVANHTRADRVSSWVPRREGLDELTRALDGEAASATSGTLGYAILHLGSIHSDVLFNVLVDDAGWKPERDRVATFGGVSLAELELPEVDRLAAVAASRRLEPGAAELDAAVAALSERVDLLIVAGSDADLPSRIERNRVAVALGERAVAAGGWRPASDWIELSPAETVRLYRNERRSPPVAGAR